MLRLVLLQLALASAVRPYARPVEVPEVAFCLAGAARSLPTIPVLRGFKRNVLTNAGYSSVAFAALDLGGSFNQALDYNTSLIRRLGDRRLVSRALEHLRPELADFAFYNHSEAMNALGTRKCKVSSLDASDLSMTWVYSLYSMQLCHSLVRTYELGRADERFDFVVRLRPDHLFSQPLPRALNLSVSHWPDAAILYDPTIELAIAPGGTPAAVFFSAFEAAASCKLTTPTKLSAQLPKAQQCWRHEAQETLASCVTRANLLYHGITLQLRGRKPGSSHAAQLARLCNFNQSASEPLWPALPMPEGTTCVTYQDVLKRPRPEAGEPGYEATPAAIASRRAQSGVRWLVLLGFVALLCACYRFGERIRNDLRDLSEGLELGRHFEAAEATFDALRETSACGALAALFRPIAELFNAACDRVERLCCAAKTRFQPVATREPEFHQLQMDDD